MLDSALAKMLLEYLTRKERKGMFQYNLGTSKGNDLAILEGEEYFGSAKKKVEEEVIPQPNREFLSQALSPLTSFLETKKGKFVGKSKSLHQLCAISLCSKDFPDHQHLDKTANTPWNKSNQDCSKQMEITSLWDEQLFPNPIKKRKFFETKTERSTKNSNSFVSVEPVLSTTLEKEQQVQFFKKEVQLDPKKSQIVAKKKHKFVENKSLQQAISKKIHAVHYVELKESYSNKTQLLVLLDEKACFSFSTSSVSVHFIQTTPDNDNDLQTTISEMRTAQKKVHHSLRKCLERQNASSILFSEKVALLREHFQSFLWSYRLPDGNDFTSLASSHLSTLLTRTKEE